MSSPYRAEWPAGSESDLQAEVADFLERLYSVSDDQTADYPALFTPDATLIMPAGTSHGTEEITAFRRGMWTAVSSRSHTISKVFPFSLTSDAAELMLYGTVQYKHRSDDPSTAKTSTVPWAGRMQLQRTGAGLQLKFYQVYFDRAPPST